MRVAIISKSDRNAGGASKVAEDLSIWLNSAGHPTNHFVAFTSNKQAVPFQFKLYGMGFKAKTCQEIHKITSKFGFRELLPVEYWFNLSQIINEYDVIHFHDLFMAISPTTLALVARHKPTFFTVHDCSAFTGGCLYPMDCEKFITYCQKCPQLRQNNWKDHLQDRTREIQTIKRYITKQFNIRYIFPSHWIAQQANLALKFKIPPVIIPNGIDLKPFIDKNKRKAKESLGISKDCKVVLISALSLNDTRKGTSYALAALKSIIDLHPTVIIVGNCNQDLREELQCLNVIEMGFISDINLISEAYSASDVMLFCSLADNLPLTVLEAMTASTVVIGFATGGVPEMIQSGLNGILVEPKNQEALNQALRQAILFSNLEKMGQQARKDVEKKFSSALFLEKHVQLYQNALAP
jgi:glycosyltransferase involved in cell wall biosynthesis